MIIDRAVFVSELPRTRNGKLDRLALERKAEEEEVAS
jgi:acyl-coenzyme A synthetase/AMP-(fatty) acid ligase